MITHVVAIKWKPETPQEVRSSWLDQVRAFPGAIDQLRSLRVGEDVLGGARSYDVAIVAEFDTLDDVQAYQVHPLHVPVSDLSAAGAQSIVTADFES